MRFGRKRQLTWEASLRAAQKELAAARAEEVVTLEQLVSFRDDAEDAQVRAMVSENTAHRRDARLAAGHLAQMEKGLLRIRERIIVLEAEELAILNRPLFDE